MLVIQLFLFVMFLFIGFEDGSQFIADSLTINTIPIIADPSDIWILRNMPVGDRLTVMYKAQIIHKPSRGFILHQPVLDYHFIPMEDKLAVGNKPSNISTVYVHDLK